MRIAEMLCLLFLVGLNPDIGSRSSRVSLFLGGVFFPLHSLWQIAAAIGAAAAAAILLLILTRALSALSSLIRRGLPSQPLDSWYRRIIRMRFWALLYLIAIPVLVSPFTAPGTKRWTLALAVLSGTASYVYFLARCETALLEKWRLSLFEGSSIRLVARSAVLHMALTAVPVVGYFIAG
jgi:hypothetical protein